MELSSLHGLSTKGGGIDGRMPGRRSSASGTFTPAAATTARDCALLVERAMTPASLPTIGTSRASKSARYVVMPGKQNMCGTMHEGSMSLMAAIAAVRLIRFADAFDSSEKLLGN